MLSLCFLVGSLDVLHPPILSAFIYMHRCVLDVLRAQVLIEMESALLDDQPHWYKLQLHDVSSLPLPSGSPYLQRRGLQAEATQSSRRLQSETLPLLTPFLTFIMFRSVSLSFLVSFCVNAFFFLCFCSHRFSFTLPSRQRSVL